MPPLTSKLVMSTQKDKTSTGSRLQPLMFNELTPEGLNFLDWANDAKVVLAAEELDPYLHHSTSEGLPTAAKWHTLLILRRHLDTALRHQYVQVNDPADLWEQLHARFHHEQNTILPQARNDWMNLRVLDFPNFLSFNSEFFRIAAQLRLSGEPLTEDQLIEKTLSTFPSASLVLAQQYRNMNFEKHSKLMSHLLLAETHGNILLKHNESKPAREIHASISSGPHEVNLSEAPRRSPRGFQRRFPPKNSKFKPKDHKPRYVNPKHKTHKQSSSSSSSSCHKCGRKGHYARECRASTYTIELYRELQKCRNPTRESHALSIPTPSDTDVENYMVLSGNANQSMEVALIDSASTHTILRSREFFDFPAGNMDWKTSHVTTIAGRKNLTFQEGEATIWLPGNFPVKCKDAMFAPDAPRSLISYRDLRANNIHISTELEKDEEALALRQGRRLLATAIAGAEGLYEIAIKAISPTPRVVEEISQVAREKGPCAITSNLARKHDLYLTASALSDIWHKRLGHPGTTILKRMIPLIVGHNLTPADATKIAPCEACIQGKMIQRPSQWQLPSELPPPLHRIQGDICGPINPASGSFRYFLVLIDASGSHLEVALLTTRNLVFPRILAILLRYKNHFPEHPIKFLRMDNALEFRSHAFEDYCTATGITLTYSVAYEHSQNGLAEAFIKKLQLVTRPLLLHAKLPDSFWGHAILHAAALLRLRPTLLNHLTPFELLAGRPPNISHLRIFGCQVWIPTAEPKRKTIGPHRFEALYLGFDSPSIIRYMDLTNGSIQKARFVNCKFVENVFPKPPLDPTQKQVPLTFKSTESLTSNPDPRTALPETEVTKLLNLKDLADQVPDGFYSGPRVLRKPLPGTGNILPNKRSAASTSNPAKSRRAKTMPKVFNTEPASDPLTLDEAKASQEWPMWKQALEDEYSSLRKHEVFGEVTSNLTKPPIGHKLIFSKKFDEHGNLIRFKVRLVAQGFSQKPGEDFDQTYAPVLDITTFRYLLAFATQFKLQIYLMDVVTAYLYGKLDMKLHIAPPPDYLPELPTPLPGRFLGLQICKALYGLKQAGRMWYHLLRGFLVEHGFLHDPALPCIFTLNQGSEFVIVAVYVDDLNLIGSPALCKHAESLLTAKFDMKLLGRTSYCLGLQVQHFPGGVLLHQQTYTKKLLKFFNMDHANALAAPMIGRSRSEDDPYRPCSEEEEIVDRSKYLTAVGAFTYLTTHTRPDIAFATNILARHSQKPTSRHWNGVKHLFRYLRGTEDLGLYYRKDECGDIKGYADSGFKTDEASGKSQTGYIFMKNGAPISWKSSKQTVTATSTNHAELLAFHEAAREVVWLRTMQGILAKQCKQNQQAKPTIIYEDNAACVNQMNTGFIKADRVKHISPHIFGYAQDLIETGQIEIRKIESEHNVADMLTKALPAYKHKKLVEDAGMKTLHELLT